MKAKTFIYSVAAGVTTLLIWEMLKPKVMQAVEQQPETNNGFDWWPFD